MAAHPTNLSGKVAVVTGASGGIGRAIVAVLRRHGATVIPTDLRADTGDDPHFRRLDVADVGAIRSLVDVVRDAYGGPHIWVNNAGTLARAPIFDLTEVDWDKSIGINLRATVFACQAAGRAMAADGGGVIVNLSSYAGLKARPNCIAYASAKAAVHHATQCLAVEFGTSGIRVNAIAPGYIDTSMSGWMHEDPAHKAQYLGRTPLGRLGEPEEVALGVLYLVSPMSSFVTGHTLVIDGGIVHA